MNDDKNLEMTMTPKDGDFNRPVRRIYITNALSSHDYEAAKDFGAHITAITKGSLGGMVPQEIYERVKTALWDSDPDDYILPSGSQVASVLAAAEFVKLHGHINILIWDPVLRSYTPIFQE